MTACIVSACFPAGTRAQITGGTVVGSVRAQTGEAIAGAKVVATHQGTNQSRVATTDEEGAYRLPGLTVGEYEITVEAERFVKVIRHLSLRVSEDSRLDFELSVAGTDEQVQVVGANAPLTETQTSVLGLVIENKQILELPLNGRNFLQLGTLVANVSSTASLSGGSEGGLLNGPFAVSGQRDRSLTFLVDGVDNNNALSNSLSAQVSIEAIQEFKLVTNLGSAEHGFHSGGMVNIVTRSGSNEFHFTAFEFFRNDKLDAANHFEEIAGRPSSKFNNNQFGATAGGPLLRDKTFFLASYEGQRLRVGQPQFARVPTLAERAGLFFNPFLNRPVQLPVDAVAKKILDRYVPLPNAESEFGNYLSSKTIRGRNDFALARFDHLLTGDDVLNARYFVSDNSTFNPLIFNVVLFPSVPPTVPGFGLFQTSRTHNLSVAHTHNFNVQTINELRFGYNRLFTRMTPEDDSNPAHLGFSSVNSNTGLFETFVPGISKLGNVFVYPVEYRINNFHIADSLNFLAGRHAIKVGGDLRLHRLFESAARRNAGGLIFTGAASRISPLADFVIGAPTLGLLEERPLAAPVRQSHFASYLQDDYQVNRRLILNVGLRYELSTVIKDPTHQLTNFSLSRGFFTPGLDAESELYKGDHNNFAPRAGFALMLDGSGRTVLRGGYGFYYDTVLQNFSIGMTAYNNQTGPFVKVSLGTLRPGSLGAIFEPHNRIPSVQQIYTYDEHLRTPYAQHFNLTLQRELGRSLLASFGYVGTKTTRLIRMRDINQPVYIPGLDAAGRPISTSLNTSQRRPTQLYKLTDIELGTISQLESASSSTYHSFQATLTKRLSHGLSVLSSYTWARSIDDATDPIGFTGDSGGPQDANDYRQERGLSSFDIRHRLTVGYTYNLPLSGSAWKEGWQINGITTLQSGQPFTPVLGFDPSLTQSLNARPNYVPGALRVKGGQVSINPNLPKDPIRGIPLALIPATGERGTLGRNTFTGPSYRNFDLSVSKTTSMGEKAKLVARFEVFNLFNTANLALPVRNLSEPLFGRSLKTQDVAGGSPKLGGGGPRVIQLALKLNF